MSAAAASRLERRFRALLRAYPVEWRERHGDAALGVLLDLAEAEGRSGPTAREMADLVARGLCERAAVALDAETRTRIASIAAGIGCGFAAAYFGVYIGPNWGGWTPASHLGPVVILLSWAFVAVAVLRPLSDRVRIGAILLAGLVPAVLWFTHGLLPTPDALIATGWSRPSNANAAFLGCVAVLALVGPVRRPTMVRASLISAVSFAVALFLTGAWRDDCDQSLWGSPDTIAFGVSGTLQRFTPFASGGEFLPGRGPSAEMVEWLRHGVLRLDASTTAVVLLALVIAVVLAFRGRASTALVVLMLACPFVVALSVCAAQPLGVWFQ